MYEVSLVFSPSLFCRFYFMVARNDELRHFPLFSAFWNYLSSGGVFCPCMDSPVINFGYRTFSSKFSIYALVSCLFKFLLFLEETWIIYILLENLQFVQTSNFLTLSWKENSPIIISPTAFLRPACWDDRFSLPCVPGPPLSTASSGQAPLCWCLLSPHLGWPCCLRCKVTAHLAVGSISCDALESVRVREPAWATQDCGHHVRGPLVIGGSGKSVGKAGPVEHPGLKDLSREPSHPGAPRAPLLRFCLPLVSPEWIIFTWYFMQKESTGSSHCGAVV